METLIALAALALYSLALLGLGVWLGKGQNDDRVTELEADNERLRSDLRKAEESERRQAAAQKAHLAAERMVADHVGRSPAERHAGLLNSSAPANDPVADPAGEPPA